MSVSKQNYENYKHVIVDDMSTDKTPEVIKKFAAKDDRIIFVRNEEKKCSLQNIHDAIKNNATDDDIIVIVDGDDFLSSPNVLSELNDTYNNNDCWLTYGSYLNLSDKLKGKFSRELPNWVVEKNLFRDYAWCTSHLRTFKAFLFNSILDEDFRNKSGEFFNMAGDLVIMFPMLEMAGKRAHYIDRIMHVYNRTNPANEDKVNHRLQLSIESEIRKKPKYELIEGEI